MNDDDLVKLIQEVIDTAFKCLIYGDEEQSEECFRTAYALTETFTRRYEERAKGTKSYEELKVLRNVMPEIAMEFLCDQAKLKYFKDL